MTFVYKYLSCNPLRVKDHRDLGGCCETSYSLEVLFGEKRLSRSLIQGFDYFNYWLKAAIPLEGLKDLLGGNR